MSEVIRANFKIGANSNVSGVLDSATSSKKFSSWSSEFFDVTNHSNIYGLDYKNRQISLLNCLGSSSRHWNQEKTSYSCEIYSHTMISGSEKVLPKTDSFTSISMTIGNASKLFRTLDSFGYLINPTANIVNSLNEHQKTPEFDVDKNPVLAYFSGDFEIFSEETAIGVIAAHNYISHGSWGTSSGVSIDNKVVLSISFNEKVSLDEAFKRAMMATKFFRFIGGDGLFFSDLTLKKSEDNHHCFNVLHDSYDWGATNDDSYYDCSLFDVTREYFPSILKSWFDKSDRESVRYSFYSTYFQGSSYSSDRLITAANMFDIFPGKTFKKELPREAEDLLTSLRNQVKVDFSGFKGIKDSLLFSIGALTRKALKERILERLEVLKPALTPNTPAYEDLEYIVGFAVKCRNYYVHGTQHKKLTPNLCFEFQSSFIDALEFIYAMSELVESDWRPEYRDHLSSHNKILSFEREISPTASQLRAALNGESA